MDFFDDGALVIGLKALDGKAQRRAQGDQTGVDLRQGGGAVHGWFTLPQHVEVRAVDDQDALRTGGAAHAYTSLLSDLSVSMAWR